MGVILLGTNMRDSQRPLIEDGRKRYGTSVSNDLPPTESELREYHAKNHSGPFISCQICEEIIGGTREMKNEEKAKPAENQTELAAFPAPGMKNSILNSVDEGRKRYGNKKLKNGTCPVCKCDMDDHTPDGRCDNCGEQCG